jgi:hypothetical protein
MLAIESQPGQCRASIKRAQGVNALEVQLVVELWLFLERYRGGRSALVAGWRGEFASGWWCGQVRDFVR